MKSIILSLFMLVSMSSIGQTYNDDFETGAIASFTGTDYQIDSVSGLAIGTYRIVSSGFSENGVIPITAKSGNKMMLSHTKIGRIWYVTFSVSSGQIYKFTGWIAGAKPNPLTYPIILTMGTTTTTHVVTPNTGWTLIDENYTVPSGVTTLTISLSDPDFTSNGSSHFLYLDNISISRITVLSIEGVKITNYKQVGKTISLDFSAINQNNTEKFILERDGVEVSNITNNGNTKYTIVDNNPKEGNNLYRIVTVGKDGNKKYSSQYLVKSNSKIQSIKYFDMLGREVNVRNTQSNVPYIMVKIYQNNTVETQTIVKTQN